MNATNLKVSGQITIVILNYMPCVCGLNKIECVAKALENNKGIRASNKGLIGGKNKRE